MASGTVDSKNPSKKNKTERSVLSNIEKSDSAEMERLEKGISLLEYLDSDLRLDLVFQLILSPEISLSDITVKVGKSKATVSRHLHILYELGFVTIREVQVRGPIKRKIYALKENILKFLCIDADFFKVIPESQKVEIYKQVIRHSTHEMNLIARIMNLTRPYNDLLQQRVGDYGKNSEKSAREIFDAYRMRNFLFALDDQELKIFNSEYAKFSENLHRKLENYRAEPDYTYYGKESIIWVGYYPIQKILKGNLDFPKDSEK